ncbi:hybrid sensor histidine kinase/response regulator [Algoriphagus namhaensis]|uniref:histidine kinase n=1 Tax=Algoriphagus namhaensis TaxID=915353 RepID=A0ABV8AX99_9BACT
MKSKINVLYIDDEDNNLKSFRATLRRDFNVFTAIDGEAGLEIARNEEVHVVIADQRMPGMTGTEFFEKMIQINPDPIRILLTGYSDISSVIDAINKGEVYRFIDKPWNIEQIKNSIKNAADLFFMRRELKEKNKKLEKLQSEMNQFVYSLSHELRGPLMSISGVAKLAKMEIDQPKTIEYFDMIESSTEKLDDYIFKMLDFYRSTKIDHKVTAIDFKQIMDQQMAAYKSKFDLQNFDISFNLDQGAEFFSDDSKIRVILNNLFSNAVQFQSQTQERKIIKLDIHVSESQAQIVIQDNGIGIDEKYIKDVFNLFIRATQRNVGTGLGLYMVKEAVLLLGGDIQIDSKLDEWTKVVVTLPSLPKDISEVN